MTGTNSFRFLTHKRTPREDRRFVMGKGRFAADVSLDGMLHIALVISPLPAARLVAIDCEAAENVEGVIAVLTGKELTAHVNPLYHGLALPNIRWLPLAVDRVRYVGEWVVAVIAESRYIAEDASELVDIDYEPLPYVIDLHTALSPDAPLVHPDHGSNLLYQRRFVWGDVDDDFRRADQQVTFSARWNRSSTVPIETFGTTAQWDPGTDMLDVWASVQMPKYAEQIASSLHIQLNSVRVHNDIDVGGSYGVKRGIKHSVLCGYLARKLQRPVRLIEDRLENMVGGDAQGPDRAFDVSIAFDNDGTIRSLKIRVIDDVGAYPGRSPLQLGKPIGAITGPYRISSVAYEAISVTTNKTGQVAVRGFGQAPHNYVLELALDRVAYTLDIDRLEVRKRNFISKHEFPYRIPSGTTYDSGDYHRVLDKALTQGNYEALAVRRDEIRQSGQLAGIGIATCLEPGGGNATFEPLMNPKNDTTTWMESCQIKVDRQGSVTVIIAASTAGQGHESLAAAIVAEELMFEPESIRVVHADSLAALPSNSPVASRMAIMLGGAAKGAASLIKQRVIEIGAYKLGVCTNEVRYEEGAVVSLTDSDGHIDWSDIVATAHRKYHEMPPDSEPGLQASFVYQVPTGGTLPDTDGRVQMYPCFSFQAHIVLVKIDPHTGRTGILDYCLAHDCGTVMNPDIVRGMMIGGIAHGIGAALYEKFEYDETGQLLSATLADYLIPTAFEVPEVSLIEHCTPSPLTSHGQKGCGEGGYLGAPAAIASAVNDALAPLRKLMTSVPMRGEDLETLIGSIAAKGKR